MKIAIVNDMAMAAEAIRRVLLKSGKHEVVWTAATGNEAVARCCLERPDLVLMDLIMPGMDGVEATRQIMSRCPCAILIVTVSVMENCSKVFEAMGAGALDAVNTPVLQWPGSSKGAAELLIKIESVCKIIGLRVSGSPHLAGGPGCSQTGPTDGRLVVIGASAGGPAALARILAYLPASFRSPIAIVQHVDSQFAAALASWLDNQTPLRVRLAQEGDCPTPGTILISRGDRHLAFSDQQRVQYLQEPSDCLYRPSVDVFFESTLRRWPGQVIAMLLTGMGRDGAKGLLELRRQGHHTIAQDNSSSAVYGMPKAAVELGAATEVLNLDQIGLRLRTFGNQGIRVHA